MIYAVVFDSFMSVKDIKSFTNRESKSAFSTKSTLENTKPVVVKIYKTRLNKVLPSDSNIEIDARSIFAKTLDVKYHYIQKISSLITTDVGTT